MNPIPNTHWKTYKRHEHADIDFGRNAKFLDIDAAGNESVNVARIVEAVELVYGPDPLKLATRAIVSFQTFDNRQFNVVLKDIHGDVPRVVVMT